LDTQLLFLNFGAAACQTGRVATLSAWVATADITKLNFVAAGTGSPPPGRSSSVVVFVVFRQPSWQTVVFNRLAEQLACYEPARRRRKSRHFGVRALEPRCSYFCVVPSVVHTIVLLAACAKTTAIILSVARP